MLRLLSLLGAHRYVIRNFVGRDLKVKYRGTVFGYLWSLLEPFSLICIYWFIFGVVAKRGTDDFPLLVALGIMPWRFFQASVSGGAHTLRVNAGLIRRVTLPREVYVLSHSLSGLSVLLLSMLAVVPLMFVYEVPPRLSWLLWPVPVLMLGSLATGIAMVCACWNVIYRDVGYVLSVSMQMGMYFSGVIYPVMFIPEELWGLPARELFLFNPIACCMNMMRSFVLGSAPLYGTHHLIAAVVICFGALQVGSMWFPRLENKAVKFL